MLKKNHQIVALAVNTGALLPFHPQLPTVIIATAITILTANIPDIDIKLPFVKHRGFTHTIWSWLLVSLLIYSLTQSKLCASMVSLSYLMHLITDSFSVAGIKWFAPLTTKSHTLFKGYKVGGPTEAVFASLCLGCYIIFIIQIL
ncbi:metal-dependent hydrolase [Periweissella beninensis]|uniref:Metal-dependent hydrolase n=1 Tax=Periweissella beninensis TaxID=504936 RepID=A0ABT0VHI9_9LACO|nr:metal-dependent hydrolase [Periweissella beninensis]MBM7543782.1 inner membrane protein [Periweissella beninensis]MCM2436834.1 metal-dependent hydrolase [Periweissella beninensis]